MTDPLRIAVISPVWFPVPPTGYGGIEWIVWLLADGLDDDIARVSPDVGFISISLNQRRPTPHLPWVANCPNALDFSLYPVKPHRGDYLLFLGRMSPDKGCHRAIDVAITAGLPLKIAGKSREPREQGYFDEYVRPHLSDQLEYLGEVTHAEKVELLQDAGATLVPSQRA